MAITLREKYAPIFAQLGAASKASSKIDETNVYQPANPYTRKIMDQLVIENAKPDSHLEGMENFKDFATQVKNGKKGLILCEHFSNTDLPSFLYLLEKSGDPDVAALSEKIVAIAGMKLNEADPMVKAYAESFTRVVIYPTRSQKSMAASGASEEEIALEETRAKKINFAAMRAMSACKERGEVILVFPSGTRYRPGKPETKRGLREIDSYIRQFDICLLVSINGSILTINPENPEDMLADYIEPVTLVMGGLPVIDCKSYRKEFMAKEPENAEDPKQDFIDHIMSRMEEEHNRIDQMLGRVSE